MAMTPGRRLAAAIAAATVLNVPYGTIYAFSVFLVALEAKLGVGRAQMSAVFALATITLTVGMNVSPRLYRVLPPPLIALGCGALGAAGIALAAAGTSYAQVLFGFGVLFGLSAGIAFTLNQQCVNALMDRPSGLVNGYIVSHYPLGAMVGAGGYGQPILRGIRLDSTATIMEGALPAAALALLTQALFAWVERAAVPRALRGGS